MGSFILSTLTIVFHLHASTSLENQFVKMDLPSPWSCQEAGIKWICHDDSVKKFKPQLTLQIKDRNPEDSLATFFEKYKNYLKNTKTRIFKGKKHVSKIKIIKRSIINDIEWIDSLILNREALDHYTRYLITQKNNKLVSLSLTAHQSLYAHYIPTLLQASQSLEIKNNLGEDDSVGTMTIASTLPKHKQHSFFIWGIADFLIFCTLVLFVGYLMFKNRRKTS